MSSRRGPSPPGPVPLDLAVELLQSWWEHWRDVREHQRTLPEEEFARLLELPASPEIALKQARQAFAEQFRPDTVLYFEQQLAAALRVLRSTVAGGGETTSRVPAMLSDRRRLDAARLTLDARDVVAAVGALEMHVQPIVSITDPNRRVLGYEALARFQIEPFAPPDEWLRRAGGAGLRSEVELSCVRAALILLPMLPSDTYVSINVSPEVLGAPYFARMLDDVAAERLVLEVTEHATVQEYAALGTVIKELRARGVRLAVDDAGAGFASLRHVLELSPDLIKLDMHLTRDISVDPTRQALVRSLAAFAADVGVVLVAEGIESERDLVALCDAGVTVGQGYLFAQPAPLELERRTTPPTPRPRGIFVTPRG